MGTLAPETSPLTEAFYREYYESDPADQAAYVSSHWADYGSRCKVEADQRGRIRMMRGAGFGIVATRNPIEPWVASLSHRVYLTRRPEAREVLALMQAAKPVCRAAGFFLSFDVFRQLCALALLQRWMPAAMRRRRLTVLVIGDGYGLLSAMLKTLYPSSTIVLVDLGRSLLFQAHACQRVHPRATHDGITRATVRSGIPRRDADFIYCPTEYLDTLRALRYDLAITIAAMQEMNARTVARYFGFLRARLSDDHLFYCCSRQSKALVGGERSVFDEYPWDPADRHLIDEICPWYRSYWSSRFPFLTRFEPIRHRLSHLAPAAG